MDWLGHGLPFEGAAHLVGSHMMPVPTCGPDDRLSDVAARLHGGDLCVVTIGDDVVLGVVEEHAFEVHSADPAMEVARQGPPTIRPSTEVHDIDERLAKRKRDWILVTDPGGRLLGVYRPR